MGTQLATRLLFLAAIVCSAPATAAPPMDGETTAWWRTTSALSGDDMHGRDTGSADHKRAVAYVVRRFRAAGLAPAGDDGGFTQTVPLHEIRVGKAGTSFDVVDRTGVVSALRFLHDISVRPTADLPASLDAPMSFRGYCGASDMDESLKGKIVVCFASRHRGMPLAKDRIKAASAVGAAGLVNVDDMGFTVEPPRWPEAYARTVALRDAPPPDAPAVAVMRLNAAAFAQLIAGSDRVAGDILADGAASRSLPHFELPARLNATFAVAQSDYSSDNVLARLPGTIPSLAQEIIVLSAHLDGYGIGEPVDGDSIYNGTFDDAAYVSTLIQIADRRKRRGFHRPVLFAAFTGEEKGLLGSTWFTQHPTVPVGSLAANINLDAVRPLFPLKILTVLSMTESRLGDAARTAGAQMGIEIRADLEPERNMRERTDHAPFLKAGIPAVCFMFGFDAGTESERIYRAWYRDRYHKPQDDLNQPFDAKAAKDFNDYVYRLLGIVADGPHRPSLVAQ